MTGVHSSILSPFLRMCQGEILFLGKSTLFFWAVAGDNATYHY